MFFPFCHLARTEGNSIESECKIVSQWTRQLRKKVYSWIKYFFNKILILAVEPNFLLIPFLPPIFSESIIRLRGDRITVCRD